LVLVRGWDWPCRDSYLMGGLQETKSIREIEG